MPILENILWPLIWWCGYWHKMTSTVFFFFLWYRGLNSGPSLWATPLAFFHDGYFQDRVSWTICLGWLWTSILLISASWAARTTGMNHRCLATIFCCCCCFLQCLKQTKQVSCSSTWTTWVYLCNGTEDMLLTSIFTYDHIYVQIHRKMFRGFHTKPETVVIFGEGGG
jgi:hypothetical protein